MNKLLPIAVFALLLWIAPAARAASGADHVKVDVVADTTAVQPGRPFTVGVRFTIDPGWHIYWTNPGDSGLATKATVTAPAGFTVGPTRYPAPSVLPQPGGLVNYGYEGTVMLLVPVTPPKELAAGKPVTIKAGALYLVCQETCLPGKGSATVELPTDAAATPANADLFGQWQARVPTDADSEHVASATCVIDSVAAADGYPATLTVVWKGAAPADVQWVPDVVRAYELSTPVATTADGTTRVKFKLKSLPTTGTRDAAVKGVLIYSPAAGPRRAVTTSAPIPIDGPSLDQRK